MKKISLSVFSFLALCILLCTACSDDTQNKSDLIQIERTIYITRDSLGKELWLEVEKNETVKIYFDSKVRAWETSLNTEILGDSCLKFQVPTLIGVSTINVKFHDSDSSYKIKLAVGMKYLDFNKDEILLGYNEYKRKKPLRIRGIKKHLDEEDPERIVSITGTYLVDKYPVTNCEITQLMWDSISMEPSFNNPRLQQFAEERMFRKKNSEYNKNCITKDTAACTIFLLQAMKYANARSIREGIKPYYRFSKTNIKNQTILSKGKYIIGGFYIKNRTSDFVEVSIDYTSDGYRLPFYDEWMMLARDGDKKNKAPWGDSSASFDEASKYARFDTWEIYDVSEPVGQLQPNGYGLYDMFGLVWEHVLFEEKNPFHYLEGRPTCLKGGDNHVKKDENSFGLDPYWKDINYGYYKDNYVGGSPAGFRLIRNIGNNVRWSNDKVQKRKQK